MRFLWAFCVVFLASCSGETAARYAVPLPQPGERIAIAHASVEVRDVSLPTYAASEEVHRERADGALKSSGMVLWADAPERAVSLELSRNLAQLTRARVANEPWPFESYPQARVEVRVEDMVAGNDGLFRLKGQYFVAVARRARERSGLFSLTVPYDQRGGPVAIAAARGQVVLDLAKIIARDGLR